MQHHDISYVFLILAMLIFALGAFSRWFMWGPNERPYYPAFLSAGLFFWVLSEFLKS